jgi:chaperonin GroEL
VVVSKVAEGKGNFGYDALNDQYTDLVKAGIIDPTKVTRSALQNAASVSTLLLTSDALIADMPKDEEKKGAAGHGGYEDMY